MNGESSVSRASVLFAGFRETGKTTFLVALWHTVLRKEVPGALQLEHFYEGDREYITARHLEWLAYEPVKRTLVDHTSPILMTLREGGQGRLLQLGIPDLSGETFKVQFEERRVTPTFVSAIRSATGIALFINPSRVDDPIRIRDVWDALSEEDKIAEAAASPAPPTRSSKEAQDGGSLAAAPEAASGGAAEASTDFESELCCTQVKYVELLQHFIEYGAPTPLRCAVIVSAIDTLDGTPFEDRPEDFVRNRMSLLDQFLRAQRSHIHSRVYGVSAQGNDYAKASVESLADLGLNRIRVCGAGLRDNDISRPVRWLAFGDE